MCESCCRQSVSLVVSLTVYWGVMTIPELHSTASGSMEEVNCMGWSAVVPPCSSLQPACPSDWSQLVVDASNVSATVEGKKIRV